MHTLDKLETSVYCKYILMFPCFSVIEFVFNDFDTVVEELNQCYFLKVVL